MGTSKKGARGAPPPSETGARANARTGSLTIKCLKWDGRIFAWNGRGLRSGLVVRGGLLPALLLRVAALALPYPIGPAHFAKRQFFGRDAQVLPGVDLHAVRFGALPRSGRRRWRLPLAAALTVALIKRNHQNLLVESIGYECRVRLDQFILAHCINYRSKTGTYSDVGLILLPIKNGELRFPRSSPFTSGRRAGAALSARWRPQPLEAPPAQLPEPEPPGLEPEPSLLPWRVP